MQINKSLFLMSSFFIHEWARAACKINGEVVPCDQFWDQFGWFFIAFGVLGFFAFLFWVWMLIDCVKSNHKDKVVWLLLIVFTNLLGAVIYYFAAKGKSGVQFTQS